MLKLKTLLFENNGMEIPENINSITDYIDEFYSIPNEAILFKLFELEKSNNPNFWFKKVKFQNPNKIAYVYNTKKQTNDYGNLEPYYILEFDGSEFNQKDVNNWLQNVVNFNSFSEYFDFDFEEKDNKKFWNSPAPLYHAVKNSKYFNSVLENGLEPRNETRGITNRNVGKAIFTSLEPSKIESYTRSNGGIVVIDTHQMKQNGYMPRVGREPEVLEKELAATLARVVGIDYYEEYEDSGIDPDTIIVYDSIPAKYIKPLEKIDEVITEPKRNNLKTLQQLGIRKNAGVKNIIAVYNEATKEEKEYWGRWYHHAKNDVQELTNKYNINFPVMAAVVATLSPGNKWISNLLAAERLVKKLKNPELSIKINSYPKQIIKAQKILETGDIGLVFGPKVSVFFKSLLDPSSVERELVLDSHAINIWRGVKTTIKTTTLPNSTQRAQMIEDYQRAAEQLGVPVQAVQATTWFIWKSIANPPKIPHIKLPVKKQKRNLIELNNITEIIQEEVKDLMSKMGYKYIGKNYRLGSDTYIQKDDPDPKSSKKYIKMANKNINKGKYGKKDTLHDPPAVGISLPKNMRG